MRAHGRATGLRRSIPEIYTPRPSLLTPEDLDARIAITGALAGNQRAPVIMDDADVANFAGLRRNARRGLVKFPDIVSLSVQAASNQDPSASRAFHLSPPPVMQDRLPRVARFTEAFKPGDIERIATVPHRYPVVHLCCRLNATVRAATLAQGICGQFYLPHPPPGFAGV
jgi:hypothetical protein